MTALRNAVAPWPTGSVLQRVSLKSREVANTACRHSNSRSAERCMSTTVSKTSSSIRSHCASVRGRYAQTVKPAETSPTAVKRTRVSPSSNVPSLGTSSACQTSSPVASGCGNHGAQPLRTMPSTLVICLTHLLDTAIEALREQCGHIVGPSSRRLHRIATGSTLLILDPQNRDVRRRSNLATWRMDNHEAMGPEDPSPDVTDVVLIHYLVERLGVGQDERYRLSNGHRPEEQGEVCLPPPRGVPKRPVLVRELREQHLVVHALLRWRSAPAGLRSQRRRDGRHHRMLPTGARPSGSRRRSSPVVYVKTLNATASRTRRGRSRAHHRDGRGAVGEEKRYGLLRPVDLAHSSSQAASS